MPIHAKFPNIFDPSTEWKWTVLDLSLGWEEQIWCLHSDLIGLGTVY